MSETRKIAAILVADVVGYGRLAVDVASGGSLATSVCFDQVDPIPILIAVPGLDPGIDHPWTTGQARG